MLGASVSKEKVKSLIVPRLFVVFSLLLLLCSRANRQLHARWRIN